MSTLVHELVADFHAAGQQAGVVERLRRERLSRPQTLIAVWTAEYGWINRVITVWEGPDSALSPLAGTEPSTDWLSTERSARALRPRRPVRKDLLNAPLLECRTYATHEGQCETFVQALLDALPHREKYSPNAGIWTSRERGHDLVWHLWAYDSLPQRMAAREGAMQDAGWAAYRAAIRPLLKGLQASLLTPVSI